MIFQGVEILVFNFPFGSACFDKLSDIIVSYMNIGHPAVGIDDCVFILKNGIFEKVDGRGCLTAV